MCGRFTVRQVERLEPRFAFTTKEENPRARFNLTPSQRVAVIFNTSPHRLSTARWGLIPSWAADEKIGASLALARADTVAVKPSFRSAFQWRRCLIPADGFYEWEQTGHGKMPHYFTRMDGDVFAFAGLWEEWTPPGGEPVRTCAIITCPANSVVAPVHARMPVILTQEQEHAWLDAKTPSETLAKLLVPLPSALLRSHPVSPAVNNARRDDPSLVEPLPPGDTFRLVG
jgi:putative SOS response-associated peptidase YedK